MSDPAETPVVPSSAPETPEPPAAPAVHGDGLWDGPRWFDAHDGEPVYIEDKAAYWAYLAAHGLRMKHQQESFQPPAAPPPVAPVLPPPPPVVRPMTAEEAQIYGAISAVLKRYGLLETIWCETCDGAGRLSGCRMTVSARGVALTCRCGTVSYTAPRGTTDLVLSTVATSSVTVLDQTTSTIVTALGPVTRPTTVLQDLEALLIRRYVAALRARDKEPRWFHVGCYQGVSTNEDNALAMSVTPTDIVLLCPCRLLFSRSTRH